MQNNKEKIRDGEMGWKNQEIGERYRKGENGKKKKKERSQVKID